MEGEMHRLAASIGALVIGVLTGVGPALAENAPPAPIVGVWQTPDKSQVTISPCPDGYCGILTHVGMAETSYARLSAADKKRVDKQDPTIFPDVQNQDPKLRTRSLVNLEMVTLKATAKPGIFEGRLYNPQDGGTYDGNVRVESQTQILLSGCLFKVLCRSQEWVRLK
jgi:uncharacterized protein (DUF2147 family)